MGFVGVFINASLVTFLHVIASGQKSLETIKIELGLLSAKREELLKRIANSRFVVIFHNITFIHKNDSAATVLCSSDNCTMVFSIRKAI